MDVQKKRVQLLIFITGIVALSITVIGNENGDSLRFTLLNCFDLSTGTLACMVKEGVKLYFYNIRAVHVESKRNRSTEAAHIDALGQGLSAKDAAKQAHKEGAKAAKLATRQAKRIIVPIISSGWDFFEAMYYWGTFTEGLLRGTGTLWCIRWRVSRRAETRESGVSGGESFRELGWKQEGLMVYNVENGVQFILQFVQPQEEEQPAAYGSSGSYEEF